VAGTYPDSSSQTEFVLVLNNDGGMTDLTLAQLGLLSMDEMLALFEKDVEEKEELTYLPYEQILAHEYIYYPNNSIYTKAPIPSMNMQEFWQRTGWYKPGSALTIDTTKGTKVKISGILRAKETTSYGSLSSGLAYMPGFTQKYLADSRASAIVQEATAANSLKQPVYTMDFDKVLASMMQGTPLTPTLEELTVRELGGAQMPHKINFFVKDFASKDVVTAHLDRWNDEIKADDEAAQIHYSDTVAVLMLLVRGMLDAVTYVLVAFTAISLVVSSVMIGVITYVSVVERTKEIGVLRSLGARKKDIRRLFNAETFLIGLAAGVFGIAVTYALSLPINLILYALTEISGLAALPFGQAILMVFFSVILTLISGLIPANAAAKKDPVIALRTE
jgi:putative ABC transport system permease protein